MCLEQVVTTLPIPWSPLPDPFTLAGDAHWADYSIAADFLERSAASARLMGRIDSADVFKDDKAKWPSGYVLQIDSDGKWTLFSTAYKTTTRTLATGTTALTTGWQPVMAGYSPPCRIQVMPGACLPWAHTGATPSLTTSL